MARRYNRDSRGRFASTAGGGKSRKSEVQANNSRLVRAGEVYSGSGATRRARSAAKQAKAEQVAIKATKAYQRRGAALASTGGARLGGKRKLAKIDANKRMMSIMKKAGDNYNLRIGAKQDTPETNKVGVKAGVRFNRQRRITKAAKRAGLGAGKKKRQQALKPATKPTDTTPAWKRAERTATWVRKPGEGWVRNRQSKPKQEPKYGWERAERTATWVRKPGVGWTRNR